MQPPTDSILLISIIINARRHMAIGENDQTPGYIAFGWRGALVVYLAMGRKRTHEDLP